MATGSTMLKRVLALWLILPPTTQIAAWFEVCAQAGHCGHEFCDCRDHCERKPAANRPCHETRPAPVSSMSDACHAGESAELLAVRTYLLPGPVGAARVADIVILESAGGRDPVLGFARIDLPPPRSSAS
jgi:hypothetical protein